MGEGERERATQSDRVIRESDGGARAVVASERFRVPHVRLAVFMKAAQRQPWRQAGIQRSPALNLRS